MHLLSEEVGRKRAEAVRPVEERLVAVRGEPAVAGMWPEVLISWHILKNTYAPGKTLI